MTQSQVQTVVADPASVDAAIESRFSARAFLPDPVPQDTIRDILRVASRAASGTNTQPWKVYVLQGASRDALVDKVCAAHNAIYADPAVAAQYREEYDYYPEKWVSPYIDRRRENRWGLYGLLGIAKGDKDAALALAKEATAVEQTMAAPSGPPEPIKPAFELYGEMLADAGRDKYAAAAFEQALLRTPNRTPSVRGLAAVTARLKASNH